MYIYVNGEIVPSEEAVISPYDHGFLYGLGVFETFRIYEGEPFLFPFHYRRLKDSLKELWIELQYNEEQLKVILQELLTANKLKNAYVRLNVSAGNGEIGLQVSPYTSPNTIIFMKELPPRQEVVEKRGVILETPRNTPEGTYRLKSHHYLNNVNGKREIGADVGTEGIFLTKEGYVAEGVVSNLFFVKGNTVYTPSLETGILNGITRQFILSLLEGLCIPYQEGLYTVQELKAADEVFVTNSIQEIVSLSHIDEVAYAKREVTDMLRKIYAREIERNAKIQ